MLAAVRINRRVAFTGIAAVGSLYAGVNMRGSRRCLVGVNVAVVASLAVGVAAGDVSARALAAKAKLPPDLIALEQKMRTLRINSERGSLEETVTGDSLGGAGILESIASKPSGKGKGRSGGRKSTKAVIRDHNEQSIPLVTADFETSISPKLAIVRGQLLGSIPFQERVIGEQAYIRSPLLVQSDGSKPWLYVSPAEQAEERKRKEAEGSSTSLVPGPESEEAGFGRMIEMLAHARSVIEVGAREVDGQQTTEFEATLYSKQLTGSAKSKVSKAVKKALGGSRPKLDLYLASDGLPVRTRLQTRLGKAGLSIVTDILATEVPISVQPPPASETITQAELEKLEEQEASSTAIHESKREKKEARRFSACTQRLLPKGQKHLSARRFRKIVRECERIAKHPESKK